MGRDPLPVAGRTDRGWGSALDSPGKGGEPSQAPLQRLPHEAAGDDDVRVGEPVVNLTTVTLGFHHPRRAHQRQVLGDIRLCKSELVGNVANGHRSQRQLVDDLEASRVGEGLEHLCL
jgi:hypothetical protein